MGGRGASYSLTGSGEKSKRTEISEKKLERLQKELENAVNEHWGDTRARQGQTWHLDKARGRAEFKRNERQLDRIKSLEAQIEKQKDVIERQHRRDNARGSLFDWKGNLNITERNYKQVKSFLKDIEKGKVTSGRTRATERNWKKKLDSFEKSLKVSKKVKIQSSAQSLIDSGKVKQWKKHPDHYFITGAQKTALVLKPDGTFTRSNRYTGPLTQEHADRVDKFIKTGVW